MAVQIQLRRGPASDWTLYNPILSEGELGLEIDTGKLKVGDGTASWSQLNYNTAPPSEFIPLSSSALFDLAGSASAAQANANAFTASAISSLIASAPETLDTLNELALALGNDANFAASTASAIGQRLTIDAASATYLSIVSAQGIYAPLVSASLTGTPTAPTATAGTNNTQIATTAFVSNAILDGGTP
jgi:hypothetical protein